MDRLLTPESSRWLCWIVAVSGAIAIAWCPQLHPSMTWAVMIAVAWPRPDATTTVGT